MLKLMLTVFTGLALLVLPATQLSAQTCPTNVNHITVLESQAKDLAMIHTQMTGQEMRAFESVSGVALETATVVLHFFEYPPGEVIYVVEADTNGCVLYGQGVPSQAIKTLISKMSAEIDKKGTPSGL